MTIVTLITVMTGIEGVIGSISMVVPLLIVWTIGISVSSLCIPSLDVGESMKFTPSPLVGGWWSATILYVSYNIVLCISVLGPLGKMAKNKKAIRLGALLGGMGLGVCAAFLHFAMFHSGGGLANAELPIMYMMNKFPRGVWLIYSLVLLAEIYTTAVGSLYGLSCRVKGPPIYTIFIVLAAFFLSSVGFSNVVKGIYPTIGYAGLILLAALLKYIYSKK